MLYAHARKGSLGRGKTFLKKRKIVLDKGENGLYIYQALCETAQRAQDRARGADLEN